MNLLRPEHIASHCLVFILVNKCYLRTMSAMLIAISMLVSTAAILNKRIKLR